MHGPGDDIINGADDGEVDQTVDGQSGVDTCNVSAGEEPADCEG